MQGMFFFVFFKYSTDYLQIDYAKLMPPSTLSLSGPSALAQQKKGPNVQVIVFFNVFFFWFKQTFISFRNYFLTCHTTVTSKQKSQQHWQNGKWE